MKTTYDDLVSLSQADRRYLVKVANRTRRELPDCCPFGNEWRNDEKLLKHGLIEKVNVKTIGCSLGGRKLARFGRTVLGACVDALDRRGPIVVAVRRAA